MKMTGVHRASAIRKPTGFETVSGSYEVKPFHGFIAAPVLISASGRPKNNRLEPNPTAIVMPRNPLVAYARRAAEAVMNQANIQARSESLAKSARLVPIGIPHAERGTAASAYAESGKKPVADRLRPNGDMKWEEPEPGKWGYTPNDRTTSEQQIWKFSTDIPGPPYFLYQPTMTLNHPKPNKNRPDPQNRPKITVEFSIIEANIETQQNDEDMQKIRESQVANIAKGLVGIVMGVFVLAVIMIMMTFVVNYVRYQIGPRYYEGKGYTVVTDV